MLLLLDPRGLLSTTELSLLSRLDLAMVLPPVALVVAVVREGKVQMNNRKTTMTRGGDGAAAMATAFVGIALVCACPFGCRCCRPSKGPPLNSIVFVGILRGSGQT